jgi:hypothetical protein
MALYSEIMRAPERLPLSSFEPILPDTQAPRWSRLIGETPAWAGLSLPSLPLVWRSEKSMMPKTALQGKPHEPAY